MSVWLDEPRCWQSRWSVCATEATGAARSVATASQRRGVEHYLASRRACLARSWRRASAPAPPGRQSGMRRRLRIRHMVQQPTRGTDRRKGGQVATGENQRSHRSRNWASTAADRQRFCDPTFSSMADSGLPNFEIGGLHRRHAGFRNRDSQKFSLTRRAVRSTRLAPAHWLEQSRASSGGRCTRERGSCAADP
jgi:hypothetical protein